MNPLELIFRETLEAIRGDRLVLPWIEPRRGPVTVLAVGKAATAMASGACRVLGPTVRGLVIDKAPPGDARFPLPPSMTVLQGSHPHPDGRSLAAGRAMVQACRNADNHVLFLLSGGASALMELPIEGVELGEVRRIAASLMAAGAPIQDLNAVRRRLSQIKGGGLSRLLGDRDVEAIVLSDVIGGSLGDVGSGPLSPPTTRDPAEIVGHFGVEVADAVREFWQQPLAPTPERSHRLAGDWMTALRVACDTIRRHGRTPIAAPEPFTGSVEVLAREIAIRGRQLAANEVWIAAGEPTIHLGVRHGLGGRAMETVLRAALKYRGPILAAGTDGTDGPTDAAGAFWEGGLDGQAAEMAAAEHNAYPFLDQRGGLVRTGATGTNLNDLILVGPRST